MRRASKILFDRTKVGRVSESAKHVYVISAVVVILRYLQGVSKKLFDV